jgi:hypothetical protein
MANTQSDLAGGRQWSVPVRGALAIVASVLVNAALVWALDAAGIAPDFRALTYPPVVFLSALGAVGATVVYVILGRYVDDVDGTFIRVAAAVLVLSFLPDLGLLAADPAATVPGVLALMLMHVVVAAASVVALVAGGTPR